jgi:hypothetical protein
MQLELDIVGRQPLPHADELAAGRTARSVAIVRAVGRDEARLVRVRSDPLREYEESHLVQRTEARSSTGAVKTAWFAHRQVPPTRRIAANR